MIATFVLSVLGMLVIVSLLCVRMILIPGGEFSRRCASSVDGDCVCDHNRGGSCEHRTPDGDRGCKQKADH